MNWSISLAFSKREGVKFYYNFSSVWPLNFFTVITKWVNSWTVADVIFSNATIFTCDVTLPFAEAMAIRKGRIVQIGSSSEVQVICFCIIIIFSSSNVVLRSLIAFSYLNPAIYNQLKWCIFVWMHIDELYGRWTTYIMHICVLIL